MPISAFTSVSTASSVTGIISQRLPLSGLAVWYSCLLYTSVDGGLSAVLCPAGENTIVFSYETPGLKLSTGVTLGAILVWLGYCGFIDVYKRQVQRGSTLQASPNF